MASKQSRKAICKLDIEQRLRSKRKTDRWLFVEAKPCGKVISTADEEWPEIGQAATKKALLHELSSRGAVNRRPDTVEIQFDIEGLTVHSVVETSGRELRWWVICKR